jgi:HpcH/HpaI aldolase/citrate lyase family
MRELTIRINGLGSPWHEEDLSAVCAAGPAAIIVPKVGTAEDAWTLAPAMEAAGASGRTALWAMIETPRVILDCAGIGSTSCGGPSQRSRRRERRAAACRRSTGDSWRAFMSASPVGRSP